ncbi:MAG: hypothetical protein IJW32_00210 [Clostridia bacterium]|nr:hypothetical protein [Clostridia bacterium]
MKNIYKKIFSCLAALVMMFSFGSVLFACGENSDDPEVKTTKVMNLNLNPSIELVLDKNNNVVSVSANNDEGNFIIAQAEFVSLSADKAVEKFLELTKDNGFLVEGQVSFSENQFKIEISGDNTALYNQVVKSAQEYLEDTNFNVNFSFEKFNKSKLQSLVRESMKELSEIEIFRMNEEQLIEKVKEIREQTKDMYSEALKDLYYKLRGDEILKAKFEAVKTQLETLPQAAQNTVVTLLSSLSLDLDGYEGSTTFEKFQAYLTDQIEELETQINTYKTNYEAQFINSGDYQNALNNYIAAKKDLLESRLKGDEATVIEGFEEAASAAYDALYGNSERQIEGVLKQATDAMETVKSAITAVNTALESVYNMIASCINNANINLQIENTKDGFYAEFSSNYGYASQIVNSKNFWNALKPEIVE